MSAVVLIVDDDPVQRVLLEELLRPEGYSVATASDGRAALEAVKQVSPDVVLLDVQMPKLNGFETCQRIKSDPETVFTPVVLVTGLTDVADRVRGLEVGADDFLSKPVDRTELLARVRSLARFKAKTDELERAETVVMALARSIEGKDPYTRGHCERLSNYSVRLGKRLGLGEELLTALRRGGVVHDVGKVAVPEQVLLKPGPLTAEERVIMMKHPVVGEEICKPLKSFRLVLPIIRHHHEKYDGSGYPDGLEGENIPLVARVLQLVDVYDALTTDRPYRRSLTTEEALDVMTREVKRGWWDARLFPEFRAMVQEGESKKELSAMPG
jgi:putative two-component system response regulator